MLKQIEGSRAVAEAVALCRPEVICAYPISPQTHIVEGLSRDGEDRRARAVRVHQRRVRVRRDVGVRSAPRRPARAPTRRPPARACCSWPRRVYNASGLGLPIVMTVANRAIGAPINIWNDHTDAMSQRDCGWIQLYAETNQEARRPAHPGVPARRGAVAAGDGVHGRLHPHARRTSASTCPTQEQVDAFLPPFEPRQVLDPDDPVTIGAMVGPGGVHRGALPRARQADAGARR